DPDAVHELPRRPPPAARPRPRPRRRGGAGPARRRVQRHRFRRGRRRAGRGHRGPGPRRHAADLRLQRPRQPGPGADQRLRPEPGRGQRAGGAVPAEPGRHRDPARAGRPGRAGGQHLDRHAPGRDVLRRQPGHRRGREVQLRPAGRPGHRVAAGGAAGLGRRLGGGQGGPGRRAGRGPGGRREDADHRAVRAGRRVPGQAGQPQPGRGVPEGDRGRRPEVRPRGRLGGAVHAVLLDHRQHDHRHRLGELLERPAVPGLGRVERHRRRVHPDGQLRGRHAGHRLAAAEPLRQVRQRPGVEAVRAAGGLHPHRDVRGQHGPGPAGHQPAGPAGDLLRRGPGRRDRRPAGPGHQGRVAAAAGARRAGRRRRRLHVRQGPGADPGGAGRHRRPGAGAHVAQLAQPGRDDAALPVQPEGRRHHGEAGAGRRRGVRPAAGPRRVRPGLGLPGAGLPGPGQLPGAAAVLVPDRVRQLRPVRRPPGGRGAGRRPAGHRRPGPRHVVLDRGPDGGRPAAVHPAAAQRLRRHPRQEGAGLPILGPGPAGLLDGLARPRRL
ncbi:MAG: Oligopeptide ABC transporter, periplasmic oligopeptide-binding protein OppA, partial [uncultured Corynebacteriales bacterium]